MSGEGDRKGQRESDREKRGKKRGRKKDNTLIKYNQEYTKQIKPQPSL